MHCGSPESQLRINEILRCYYKQTEQPSGGAAESNRQFAYLQTLQKIIFSVNIFVLFSTKNDFNTIKPQEMYACNNRFANRVGKVIQIFCCCC